MQRGYQEATPLMNTFAHSVAPSDTASIVQRFTVLIDSVGTY
jgi:hypothetical protein